MPDCIHLEQLELLARLGVPDDERATPQRLALNLTLEPAQDFRALDDRIENTVDYFTVAQMVQQLAAARPRRLLETLAEEIAQEVLARFAVRAVAVELRKFILPDTAFVAVRLRRERAGLNERRAWPAVCVCRPTMTNYLLLIILPLLLGLVAQWRVKSAFGKYSGIRATSNISGADAARQVLATEQIRDVEVVEIDSMLGDHYDPSTKRLCLSSAVYHEPSIAALGIAAHEAGHAIQHARHYGPLRARMALVPVTMYASKALPFIMIGGFFFQMAGLLKLGIICYLVLGVFQLITLPVEFDASARAKVVLRQMGLVSAGDEATGVNRVLDAAAWTYVAAFVAVLGNLFYLIMATQGRRD